MEQMTRMEAGGSSGSRWTPPVEVNSSFHPNSALSGSYQEISWRQIVDCHGSEKTPKKLPWENNFQQE